jgi:tetratricopeptide (TPR) repeat protein
MLAAVQRGDAAEARRWDPLAAGAIERLGRPRDLEAGRLEFLGLAATLEGRNELALELYRQALALQPEPGTRGGLLTNAAIASIRLGHLDAAEALLEEALALLEDLYGPNHPIASPPHYYLGELFARRGEPARALAEFQRAYDRFEGAGLAETSFGAIALTGVARGLLDLGRAGEARERLERCLARLEGWAGNPAQLAVARFELARAQVATGGDRRRALLLAGQAREALERIGAARAYDLERVEGWLASVG